MQKSTRADILLLTIAMVWAATFIIIKNALDDIPPFFFTAFRFLIASIIGIFIWGKYLVKASAKDYMQGAVLGAIFGIGFLLQTWGLQYTTIAKSSFITGSMVIFTPIVYYLVERRPVSLMQKVGVCIVTIGLWIFTDPDFTSLNYGDIATILCAVLWGVYITFTDVFTRDRTDIVNASARLTLLQFMFTCIISYIAYIIFEYRAENSITILFNTSIRENDVIIAISYTAILGSVIATYIQTRWQRDSSPVRAALIFSLEPIIASMLAFIIIKEHFGMRELLGGIFVLTGVLAGEVGETLIKMFTVKK